MHNSCRRCGKEAKEGELYCSQCTPSDSLSQRKIWYFAVFFLILLLILAIMLFWNGNCCRMNLSRDDSAGKSAVGINSEKVGAYNSCPTVAGSPALSNGCCGSGGSN